MNNSVSNISNTISKPVNEPVLNYAPGEKERMALENALVEMRKECIDIPLIIDGKEIHTESKVDFREPHKHSSVLAKVSQATEEHALMAVQAAMEAKAHWERMPWSDRATIFQTAAELMATTYRAKLNAATMLGQSKSALQAEIDSACELIDFLRFNAFFMQKVYAEQPESAPGISNRMEHRPLEGFIFAITPFNFTAIAGNLPSAPAMLGNTAVWKPSGTSVLSNYIVMKIFEEAGMPAGVINFLPGPSSKIAEPILKDKDLGGVHFTGSTSVFRSIWKTISNNIEHYRSYPRIVGETGGKDFVVAHPSADVKALSTALVRGAFEYQGQKCSAASRAYIPKSLWSEVKSLMQKDIADMKMGDVTDFSNFINAVIDEKSFDKISGYIQRAKESSECEIIFGGECSKEEGYFIHPTVIETTNPQYESMVEEIFGPVLTVYIYEDEDYRKTLELCDQSSEYALTGAIFAKDKPAVNTAMDVLRHAAGNFYVNDKPTGAVVGQQPFGGSRASGTNDKAGSVLNLYRWVSPQTIKETYDPPTDYRYPFMG